VQLLVSLVSGDEAKEIEMGTLFKGVVLGAVTSTLVLVAASAVAGTGVGGVFNLGKTNTVNAKSTLTGERAHGKMLEITNAGAGAGATALGLNVAAGRPPLTVNSDAKVVNLNADKVDGKEAGDLVGPRAYANVYGGDCTGFPAYCPIQESKGVAYAVNVAPGDYCVGIPEVPGNSVHNLFLFTHGEPGLWVIGSASGACTHAEHEVKTYSGATPQNQFFKILIP
jgi:hypothetical protein